MKGGKEGRNRGRKKKGKEGGWGRGEREGGEEGRWDEMMGIFMEGGFLRKELGLGAGG